jgi:hypothetical protein
MARTGSFLSGPTGVHGTQKIRKHKLKRGLTRDYELQQQELLLIQKSPL